MLSPALGPGEIEGLPVWGGGTNTDVSWPPVPMPREHGRDSDHQPGSAVSTQKWWPLERREGVHGWKSSL